MNNASRIIIRHRRFRIGSAQQLSTEQLDAIGKLLERRCPASSKALLGRGSVVRGEIPDIGPVIVKRYARGGLLRHVLGRRYLRLGPTRGELEFDMLNKVRALGVRAPEPVAFAYYGKVVVHAWLITKEVAGWSNLAELARADEERVRAVGEDLTEQIANLVRAKILHVDLHPGNIVVDNAGAAHIVDFDKARKFEGRANRLRDRYLIRWRRAVIKHELPELLSELICLGLRRNFEG